MESLTADEAEQYDRQIRLWGLEAQKRLRMSRVLVVGASGLGAELCKNIVLAGVKSVTLLDHALLTPCNLASRFLGHTDGVNRAEQAVEQLQALNPNVKILADTDCIDNKDDAFFTQFSAVVHGIKFFCGDVWGFYGYFFSDLGEHEYAVEMLKEDRTATIVVDEPQVKMQIQQEEKISVKRSCSFPSLREAMTVGWASKPARYFKRTPSTWFIVQTLQAFRDSKNGRDPSGEGDRDDLLTVREMVAAKLGVNSDLVPADFYKFCLCELSPVCAIVGGVLGQEVIKALSGKDEPYHNCFLYDGVNSTGIVESLRPSP